MRQSQSPFSFGRTQDEHDTHPIHLTGQIQPHGVLMVLEQPRLTIVQISKNSQVYLDRSPQNLLNQDLSEILESASMTQIRSILGRLPILPTYFSLPITTANGIRTFDALIHSAPDRVILELVPATSPSPLEWVSIQNFTGQAMTRLRQTKDLSAFLQLAVKEIQTLTGYERVMVYQFDSQQSGAVVAEIKPEDSNAYLGLHYPATDIPAVVRQLYQREMVRYVPDLTAPAVELVLADPAVNDASLDLSLACLRSVDPCCVEYHQNMGVTAMLVIALVTDNRLWGLISCHHPTPKSLSYPIRSACSLLGQLIAAELLSKVHEEERDYLIHLKGIQTDFIRSIAEATDFKQALIQPQPRLLELVNAQGAAVCLDQDITLIGDTPSRSEVQGLIDWALLTIETNLFHTDCLSSHHPAALAYKQTASGLLVLKISPLRRYLILWFRPEVLQSIDWAGDPKNTLYQDDGGRVLLCPRTSFERWQETVEATAHPWKMPEIENAADLRNAIVGIVLNKADELAQINLELQRSNKELDSFVYAASHDLKEPLRGITNFANILVKRHASDLNETGLKRLKTLVKLAQRMDKLIDALLKFSRLGQAELQVQPTDLDALVSGVIEVIKAGWSDNTTVPLIRIPRSLPTIPCDPILVSEVFSNLISNAIKYTDKAQAQIEIGYILPGEQQIEQPLNTDTDLTPLEQPTMLYVKDNGLGIRERHFQNIFRLFKRLHERDAYGGGAGVGLTITQKIIERHGGQVWVESVYGEGTTFYFILSYAGN